MPLRRSVLVAVVLVAAATSVLVPAPAHGTSVSPWSWPVPAPHPVVRGFEAPATEYAAGHRGIDVRVAVGTVVRAPADGVVTYAGVVVDRGVLAIDVGDGVVAGFEPVTPAVETGAVVHRGDPVAVVATGGTHPAGVLHIAARSHGAYVSPLRYLVGYVRPVLLPLAAAG